VRILVIEDAIGAKARIDEGSRRSDPGGMTKILRTLPSTRRLDAAMTIARGH
jgi:hypothetical protein